MMDSVIPNADMAETNHEKLLREKGWRVYAIRWAPWLVALQVFFAVCAALVSKHVWIEYLTDDYFYYLKVAQNLAAGHGSTFNGIVPTNGYHPLWLLLLTAFNYFTQNGPANMAFIGVLCLAATVACFVWTRSIFLLSGVDNELVATCLAIWTAVYCCRRFYVGMEITLTVPLVFLLILLVLRGRILESAKSAFYTGLVCSLLILSRLDAGFLVALLGVSILLSRDYRQQINSTKIFTFLAGLVPFFAYLVINKVKFGTLLPVSGLAKQLKSPAHFSWSVWTSVIVEGSAKEHFHTAFILLSTVVILLSYRKLAPRLRVVFPAVLLFPLVYYTTLGFLTDWRSLSAWYVYPMRPSLCIALAFWFSRKFMKQFMLKPLPQYILLAAAVLALATNVWPDQDNGLSQEARAIREFAATHPGIYAMGDRAGKTAFLLPYPLIQLEGLVMDLPYLKHLTKQEDLHTVFDDYHVRYYIADSHKNAYTGCFEAIEPWEAGPDSKKMSGTFCHAPIWQQTFRQSHLMIFDLNPSQIAARN